MKAINGLATIRPMLAVMMVSLALVGCASSSKKKAPPPPPSFDTVMSEAESKVPAGPDVAIKAFESAAKTDPTRKEPWVRIAQLQFDRGDYARAIVAAEEVLQRDPDDLVADGVITVAGFRVANQSLQRLHQRGALASDTARTEAETLANTLRSTMGDSILAPEPPRPKRKARPARRAASSASAAPASTPAAAPSRNSGNSDPFKSIGGN